MIIIGHPLLDFEPFYKITSIEEAKKTPPNSTILFDFDKDALKLFRFAKKNRLPFAVEVKSVKELLISNGWGASYAVINREFAKTAQKLAEEYLFDMKILVKIESEIEMEELAKDFIDGVIFERSIIDGKS
jgi:hypothetical protein